MIRLISAKPRLGAPPHCDQAPAPSADVRPGSVPGIHLLVLFVALVGLGAMAAEGLAHRPWPPVGPRAVLAALLIGALAELTLINIRFGHNRYSFTWSEAFIIVGVVLVPEPWLVLLTPVGVAAMHLAMRRPSAKVAFNAFGTAAGACFASLVYETVRGVGPSSSFGSLSTWLGLVAASGALYVWNHSTVAGAVALSQGLRFRDVVTRGVPLSIVVWVGNTCTGCSFLALYRYDPGALFMVPILLATALLVYRAYLRATQDAEIWRLLQSVTRELTELDLSSLGHAVVQAAESLFAPDFVELMILDAPDRAHFDRHRGGTGHRFEGVPVEVSPALWPRARVEHDSFLATRSRDAERAELERLGLSSCLVAPLVSPEQCMGMLRLGFSGPVRISEREMQVYSTFANQVTTSLCNAQLYERTAELSEQARAIAESLGEGVLAIDRTGRVTFANPAAAAMVGRPLASLVGDHIHEVLHGADGAVHPPEVRCRLIEVLTEATTVRYDDHTIVHHRAGPVPVAFTASPMVRGDRLSGAVIALRDMTERRALEAQLTYQAFHDPTTDAGNRSLFVDRLQHVMARRSLTRVGVLFVDLDRFKVINDSLGHRAGDALLRQVAQRISGCLRPADTLARWGGDEFTVLLESLDGESEAVAIARRILAAMTKPFPALGREVVLSVSIGVALARPLAGDPQQVIHDADVAMYRAKYRGRDTYVVYEPEMEDQPLERLEMETALRRGLEAGEFQVYYQPIVSMGSGRIAGVEALVRWNTAAGLLTPAAFIGLAEETGLILRLGQIVLEQACRQAKRWHDEHPASEPLLLSVNLSARQFQDGQLGRTVAEVLARTGLDPHQLCLEITETVIMQDVPSTMATLNELKALGVQLSIDDFGTGYSSLSYLKRFPVDAVKIDRSFIDGLGLQPVDTEIVAAVIRLARSLGMRTVAEGVETRTQLETLREMGCPFVQGFYFSPAQTEERLEAMLEAQLEPAG